MNLRAVILLGWKQPTTGIPPVENLYTGQDGAALAEAHAKAQKSGEYIAFRKVINPSGIPMPMTVDPAPKAPVFPGSVKTDAEKKQDEIGNHPVEVRANAAKKAAAKAATK